MIKWAYLFSSTIRSRGGRYYRDGNVLKVEKQGNRFTASVRGEQTYQVKITMQADRIKSVSCTCPYAKGGMKCKHMAAVFYAIDNGEYEETEGKEETLQEEWEKLCCWEPEAPWQKEPLQGYQYFDYRAMAQGLTIPKPLLREAAGLAEAGTVVLENVRLGYIDSYYGSSRANDGLIGIAAGRAKDGKERGEVTLLFDRNSVMETRCGLRYCRGHYEKRLRYANQSLCAHALAANIIPGMTRTAPGRPFSPCPVCRRRGERSRGRRSRSWICFRGCTGNILE